MIKAIIFDCFGVLTEDSWVAFCRGLDPAAAQRAHELSHQHNRGFLTDDEFIQQVAEITNKPLSEIRATQASVSGDIVKNVPLITYIRDLKSMGYQMGILSNIGSDWITSALLTPDEQQLFSHMILSYEVHLTKPDARIYQLAAARFGLLPEEIAFIDDQEAYVSAAAHQSMHGLCYRGVGDLKKELTALLNADK